MAQPHFPTPPLKSDDDFERDLHTEHQLLNMGPSHPATHGTVKFLVEVLDDLAAQHQLLDLSHSQPLLVSYSSVHSRRTSGWRRSFG